VRRSVGLALPSGRAPPSRARPRAACPLPACAYPLGHRALLFRLVARHPWRALPGLVSRAQARGVCASCASSPALPGGRRIFRRWAARCAGQAPDPTSSRLRPRATLREARSDPPRRNTPTRGVMNATAPYVTACLRPPVLNPIHMYNLSSRDAIHLLITRWKTC